MKVIPSLLLAALCCPAALACDQVEATRAQLTFTEMGATWRERDGRVTLDWGWAWDGAAARQRLGLLQAFADGDACLARQRRPIEFYRKGRLVGTAGPAGVQLVGQPVSTWTAGAAPAAAAECPK